MVKDTMDGSPRKPRVDRQRQRGAVLSAIRVAGSKPVGRALSPRSQVSIHPMMPEYRPLPLCSFQASAEHFQQCAEFALLRNRGLGPLAVTVLPTPFARRAAATACSVQSTAPL